MKLLFSTIFVLAFNIHFAFGQFYVYPTNITYAAHSPASVTVYNYASGSWSITSALPSWLTLESFSSQSMVLKAAENTGNTRNTNISLYNSTYNQYNTIYVSQNSSSVFDVSPSNFQFPSNPSGSSTIFVSGTGGWSIYSTIPDWIQINPTSGTGTGSITLTPKSNAGNPSRGSYIYLYNSSQDSYKYISLYQNASEFYVSPSNLTFAANSPVASTVYIPSSGSWSISSVLPSWLSVSPSSGSQSYATVQATTNNGGERSSSISFYNSSNQITSTVQVTQRSKDVFDVSPTSLTFQANNPSSKSIYISGTGSWSIFNSLPDWLNLSSTNGNGPTSLEISAKSNPNGYSRYTYISLYNSDQQSYKYIEVNQPPSEFYVSPSSIRFSANSPVSSSVYVGGSGSWSITSVLPNWLTVDPTSGIASGYYYGGNNITLTATSNSGNERSADVILYNPTKNISTTLTVVQNSVNEFDVSPSYINFEGYSASSKSIYISGSGSWSIYNSLPSWVTPSQTSGTGPTTITMTAKNNDSQYTRYAYLYLYNSDQGIYKYVNISQNPSPFSVSPSSVNFSANAPSSSWVYISASGPWSISSTLPSWLTISPTSGYNSTYATISATSNTGNGRSSDIVFHNSTYNISQTLNVSQNSINVFDVSPSSISFSANSPASSSVYVSGTGSWSIIQSLPSWLTASKTSGNGPTTINFTASSNNDGYTRYGYIYLYNSGQDIYKYISVSQNGSSFYTYPSNLNFTALPSNSSVYIAASGSWSISSSLPSWLSVDRSNGYGYGYINFSASQNTGPVRSSTIGIYNSYYGNTTYLTINQNSGQTFVVTPSNVSFSSSGNSSKNLFISGSGAWSLSGSLPTWLTLSKTYGSGTSTISLDATKNIGNSKSATLTFYNSYQSAYQYVYVNQDGASFFASPSRINFKATPTGPVTVNLSNVGNWQVSSSIPSWISLSTNSGSNGGSISISAQNNTGGTRSAIVTLQDLNSSESIDIKISQNDGGSGSNFGTSTPLISSTFNDNSTNTAISGTFTISSMNQWNISNIPVWLQLSVTSGSGDAIVSYTVTSFNASDEATILITSGNNVAPMEFKVERLGIVEGLPNPTIKSTQIYPNPTSEDIHIIGLAGVDKIYIIDVLGTTVYENNNILETLDIPTSELAAGVYHVFMVRNGTVEKQKVVVLK